MKAMTQQSLRTTLSFHSILALILVAWGALVATTTARGDDRDEDRRPESNTPLRLAALKEHARVTRDAFGVAHVRAENDHDLYFLAGYVHAQDRLFQMDVNRRLGNGTLAELLGEGALTTDVQLRTIGLRRAAERSLAAISPRTRAVLEAYAEGVNACVAAHPLPPEYGGLELTHFEPWTALDSVTVAKLIAFGQTRIRLRR